MTEGETRALLTRLLAVWPEREVTDQTVAEFWGATARMPAAVMGRAVDEWISGQKFFPRPSELVTLGLRIWEWPARHGLPRGIAVLDDPAMVDALVASEWSKAVSRLEARDGGIRHAG